MAHHPQAVALAWTLRAVYVEWEGPWNSPRLGLDPSRRARATPDQSPLTAPWSPVNMMSVRDAEPLVELIKANVARSGAEFVTSAARPAGPFDLVVFGSIEHHPVRLELSADLPSNACALQVFDLTAKQVLAERVATPTFKEVIEAYAWDEAIEALSPL